MTCRPADPRRLDVGSSFRVGILDTSLVASTRSAPLPAVPRRGSRRSAVVANTLVGPGRVTSSSPTPPRPPRGGSQLKGRDVEEAAMWRCIELQERYPQGNAVPFLSSRWSGAILDESYERCGEVTSEFAKTFYLGTQLMTPKQARAIWAIYVWCRRTDELVDGPNASKITPEVRRNVWCPRQARGAGAWVAAGGMGVASMHGGSSRGAAGRQDAYCRRSLLDSWPARRTSRSA